MTTATAVIYDFAAARKAKEAGRVSVAIRLEDAVALKVEPVKSHFYYVEYGAKADPSKMIRSKFCHSGYSLQWSEKDDEQVRQLFKTLRVRPLKRSNDEPVRLVKYGSDVYVPQYWQNPAFGHGVNFFDCYVTSKAFEKLQKEGVISHEMLLD